MAGHVYKKIEVTGSSTHSMEDAVKRAIERSSETVRNMRWFEVTELRGHIENDMVQQWQVTLKIGFDVEEHER